MEIWTILFKFIFIYSQLIFHGLEAAPELKNYPECVQNSNGSALIGVEKRNRDNSASNCASYCKEKNFIFSGTMNYLCICGNALTIGIRTSSRCETRCPGNTTETCGGEDSVSLRRTGYESGTIRSPKPSGAETSSEINVSPKTDESGTTRSPKPSGAETSSEINVSPKTDESGTTRSPKQSGAETSSEINVSHKPDESGTTRSPKQSGAETSSEINVSHKPDESGTTRSPKKSGAETSSEINVSPKTDTNTCAEKGSQIIAVYITLPVVVIVAASAALIVHLVLRHRRLAKEASVRQHQDLSCHITYDSARNIMLDHHPYQALHREINRYMYAESSDERITEEDKCDAGYITPVLTNDTVDTYTNYPH